MPALSEAIKQMELNMPTIELRRDIILFMFGSKERAKPTQRAKAQGIEEGNPYMKGSFVGEDEQGNLTCQKVLNVSFSNNRDITTFTGNGDDVEGFGSSYLVFLMGQFSVNDVEPGNQSYTLSASSICRYDSTGEFYYSEEGKDGKLKGVTLKGTPGEIVTVSLAKSGVMKMAPKLDPSKRSAKSPIKVSRNPVFGKKPTVQDDNFEIKAEIAQAGKEGTVVDSETATF
jgi:hypothetical protein